MFSQSLNVRQNENLDALAIGKYRRGFVVVVVRSLSWIAIEVQKDRVVSERVVRVCLFV